MALESSIFALGSADSVPFSAVFLPTNLRLGCFAAAGASSDMFSSTSGPRLVAARSSSMVCRGLSGWWWWRVKKFVGLNSTRGNGGILPHAIRQSGTLLLPFTRYSLCFISSWGSTSPHFDALMDRKQILLRNIPSRRSSPAASKPDYSLSPFS